MDVIRRVVLSLGSAVSQRWLYEISLNQLAHARAALYRAILSNLLPQPSLSLSHVADAVIGLRGAGRIDELPGGLLTASLYHFVRGEHDAAQRNLDEAELIAKRGPLPLHLADVHLHRARMFRNKKELVKATEMCRKIGYGRRYDELIDAESAARSW